MSAALSSTKSTSAEQFGASAQLVERNVDELKRFLN
jgi:hypothetical protein